MTEGQLGLAEYYLQYLDEKERRRQALRACHAIRWGGDDELSYAFLDLKALAASVDQQYE